MHVQPTPINDSSAVAVRCARKLRVRCWQSLEYLKISIVIVDDPLPADGRSPIINTSCRSTMQICVAAWGHRNLIRRQSMLEKVNKQKLVVIGNGMAGIRTVEVLLERAPDLYDITVFGSGAIRQLQPNPAVARARRREDRRRHHAQHRCSGTRITASRCARAK